MIRNGIFKKKYIYIYCFGFFFIYKKTKTKQKNVIEIHRENCNFPKCSIDKRAEALISELNNTITYLKFVNKLLVFELPNFH